MRVSVVVPTYWTSVDPIIQVQNPDAVYDHPTPLESKGSTLPRLLSNLEESDLPEGATIIVIVATSHRALEDKARKKTQEILSDFKKLNIVHFSASTLRRIGSQDQMLAKLLNSYGYSNIRNLGLAIAQILKSEILVFLDDDVLVKDPRYFHKVQEHIGNKREGALLGGVAGYYTDKSGRYYLDVSPRAWWKAGWPKEKRMNEAFEIIQSGERLLETTFAFGGNMVLHWNMFEKVPFDPYITRGEDMDLLVNAKLLGFEFMLDTRLSVIHLPGEGKSLWSEMRQDLYRFLYMRKKLLLQKEKRFTDVSIRSLLPYPGYFLGVATPFRFALCSCLNSAHSILKGNLGNFKEFSQNIFHIADAFHFAGRNSLRYFGFQRLWATHIPRIRDNRDLRGVLEGSS